MALNGEHGEQIHNQEASGFGKQLGDPGLQL